MPICETCSDAITNLRPQEKALPSDEQDVHTNLPRFGNWTFHTCWVCSKFSTWLEVKHPELFSSWREKKLPVKYAKIGFGHARRPGTPLVCLLLLNLTVQGLHRENDACEFEVNLIPEEDFITRPFALPKRRLDLLLAKRWIESCRRNHVKCEKNTDQWYPTRLLHFGPSDSKITLVISKDHYPKGPYISLSHRWGTYMRLKLTPTTIAQLRQGVPITSLSRVFRDSIMISQQLGIRYLWIDALCIIQDEDDLADWNIESKMMNKVYANAFLNISATLSHGDESLFQDKDLGPTLPSEIQLDIDSALRSYFAIDGDMWRDEIDNAPLNNRGWVYQERFSARRVLHFGRQQLLWECRELEASEMFVNGLHQAITASYLTKSKLYNDLIEQPQISGGIPDGKLSEIWHIMVESYSKCELTLPKDKLIAFNGVAQAVMTTRGGQCVAGVWQHNIAYDLTWYRYEEAKELFPNR